MCMYLKHPDQTKPNQTRPDAGATAAAAAIVALFLTHLGLCRYQASNRSKEKHHQR